MIVKDNVVSCLSLCLSCRLGAFSCFSELRLSDCLLLCSKFLALELINLLASGLYCCSSLLIPLTLLLLFDCFSLGIFSLALCLVGSKDFGFGFRFTLCFFSELLLELFLLEPVFFLLLGFLCCSFCLLFSFGVILLLLLQSGFFLRFQLRRGRLRLSLLVEFGIGLCLSLLFGFPLFCLFFISQSFLLSSFCGSFSLSFLLLFLFSLSFLLLLLPLLFFLLLLGQLSCFNSVCFCLQLGLLGSFLSSNLLI